MKQKFYKYIILLVLLGILLITIRYFIVNKHNLHTNNKNICTGYLTDKEYLEHMIPHHQVAVDISVELQKQTKWPKMQEILRKLIWTQKYEITLMHELKHSININTTTNNTTNNTTNIINNKTIGEMYKPTVSDYIYPNKKGLTHTYCDPHFFDPEKHMEHIKHMNLTDEMYIHHMIPHHQVAVDMSKVLLTNTTNSHMIYLANRIIRSQQEEIILLNELLTEKNYKAESNILI